MKEEKTPKTAESALQLNNVLTLSNCVMWLSAVPVTCVQPPQKGRGLRPAQQPGVGPGLKEQFTTKTETPAGQSAFTVKRRSWGGGGV